MLQSTGEGTFETAAEQTAQLLAFDQETDPFCVEKSALVSCGDSGRNCNESVTLSSSVEESSTM